MKISLILPFVVGSAAAGVLASISPAQALSWDLTYTYYNLSLSGKFSRLTLTTTDTAPDANGFYQITSLTGTQFRGSNATISLLPVNYSQGNNNLFNPLGRWNGSPYPVAGFEGIAYYVVTGSFSQTIRMLVNNDELVEKWVGSSNLDGYIQSVTVVATPAAPVPFDIPGGATIPTVGSLLALGAMRKIKKSIALKTRIANPVTTTVS